VPEVAFERKTQTTVDPVSDTFVFLGATGDLAHKKISHPCTTWFVTEL